MHHIIRKILMNKYFAKQQDYETSCHQRGADMVKPYRNKQQYPPRVLITNYWPK